MGPRSFHNDIAIHFKTDLKDAQEFLNKIDKIRLENDGQELDNGKVDEETTTPPTPTVTRTTTLTAAAAAATIK